jgi:hypothetical protein
MINRSNKLKGLKFISVIRLNLTEHDNSRIWHPPEDFIYMHARKHKTFSYSVIELYQFTKTNDQLKTLKDKWLKLLAHGSNIAKEEADDILGDEPMFQEIFQLLKLDNLTEDVQKLKDDHSNEAGNQKSISQRHEIPDIKFQIESDSQSQLKLEDGLTKGDLQ